MTESRQPVVLRKGGEAPEPPSCDVLEKDALDGILRAKVEDLVQPWLDRIGHGTNRRTVKSRADIRRRVTQNAG